MRITGEMILTDFGTKLPLDRGRKYALGDYARRAAWAADARSAQRWVEKRWGLKDYEAKDLLKGNSSEAVYERIKKHPNGGWSVILAVEAAVVGQTLEDWVQVHVAEAQERLSRERQQFEQQEQQLAAMADKARALAGLFVRGSDEPALRQGGQGSEHPRQVGARSDRDAVEPAEAKTFRGRP